MSAPLPVQKFRLGDRVRRIGCRPFVIDAVCIRNGRVEYSALGRDWVASHDLTLCPEHPPYEPSERRICSKVTDQAGHLLSIAITNANYRCETDTELAIRHAAERATYATLRDTL